MLAIARPLVRVGLLLASICVMPRRSKTKWLIPLGVSVGMAFLLAVGWRARLRGHQPQPVAHANPGVRSSPARHSRRPTADPLARLDDARPPSTRALMRAVVRESSPGGVDDLLRVADSLGARMRQEPAVLRRALRLYVRKGAQSGRGGLLARALAAVGDDPVRREAVRLARDSNPGRSLAGFKLLEALGTHGVDVRVETLGMLDAQAPIATVSGVLRSLGDPVEDPATAAAVLAALDRIVPDADDEIRRLANVARATWARSIDDVTPLIATARGASALAIRIDATAALGALRTPFPEAIDALRAQMLDDDGDPSLRYHAWLSLSRLDVDASVRAELEDAARAVQSLLGTSDDPMRWR